MYNQAVWKEPLPADVILEVTMKYSETEVIQYVEETDVKFIRLAFCDVYGKQKNAAIMASELDNVFRYGAIIDASSIAGFGGAVRSDVILHPDPSTLTGLPWRPENGRVVRMLCDVTYPDGTPLEADCRNILKRSVEKAAEKGITFAFGTEMEFYLFKNNEDGEATRIPYDNASYMDVAPDDKGENVRREICLTLEQMGIKPEGSHHEAGPGQNEIDFTAADPVTAADNAVTFTTVVKTIAARNGLTADFSPKPLGDKPGNGMHINLSVNACGRDDVLASALAGILNRIGEITIFLNPDNASYERLGICKAPGYISWSNQGRSPLIRIPAENRPVRKAEIRSADCRANPYIAFTLMIEAALEGIEKDLALPKEADMDLYSAAKETLSEFKKLPENREEAIKAAKASDFVSMSLPERVIGAYCGL